ncbi:iron ABC transporter substrate-binding protein, partial [Streptococcus uberis]
MRKKMLTLMVASTALLSLTACGSKERAKSASQSSDKLVVYSPNSEGLINATIPAFEEKYGIKVELIQAGTGELFKKVESESSKPVADIVFGGS